MPASLDPPLRPDDHVSGPADAPYELVMYGDFECPYCAAAQSILARVRKRLEGELRFAFRHLPLESVHPHARHAAEAAEAAAAQGAFWAMHDKLLDHQDALTPRDLGRYAEEIGLDGERFWDELRRREYAPRVADDVASADSSGVAGTPTFFINGRRHQGAYDIETLTDAVQKARHRALLKQKAERQPEPQKVG